MLYITKLYLSMLIILLIGASGVFYLVPVDLATGLNQENSILEVSATIFLGLAALLSFYLFVIAPYKGWGLYCFFMSAAFARELDWHKEFTSMSIFKSRFYTSSDVILFEKIMGLMVIVTLLIAFILLSRKIKSFWQLLLEKNKAVSAGVIACLLIIMGKILDGFFRYFPSLKPLRHVYGDHLRLFEEGLEMVAAGLFCLIPILIGRFFKRQP